MTDSLTAIRDRFERMGRDARKGLLGIVDIYDGWMLAKVVFRETYMDVKLVREESRDTHWLKVDLGEAK